MGQNQPEIPDEDDADPILRLADFLYQNFSVATLATAIEKHGIYTWDRFGRFVKADEDAQKRAMDLLAMHHAWEEDPEIQFSDDPRSPLEQCEGSPDNPYCYFGWTRSDVPNFDQGLSGFASAPGRASVASRSCAPVEAGMIRRNFLVIKDIDANEDWWKKRMAEAERYGLLECRVGEGKKGKSGGSLWRPDMIAGWLVDRHTKGKEGLPDDAVRKGLKQFPGYEDIAEEMFPEDE